MAQCLKAIRRFPWLSFKHSALLEFDPARLSGTVQLFAAGCRPPYSCYVTAVSVTDFRNAKPFSAIPGPRRYPLIGSLYTVPKALKVKNGNDVMFEHYKKYGAVVREQFGPRIKDSLLSLFDIEAVEILHRHDGKYPRRIIMESWQSWRDDSPFVRGILIEDGPDWKRMRAMLDKQMLRPRQVHTYAENFGQVTMDFIDRLRKLREREKKTVKKLSLELFHWSLESIGTVLYETRFGGLSDDRDPEMQEFIEAVHNLFTSTNYTFYLPRKLNKIILPKWQKMHDDAWKVIFKHGKKHIDKKYVEIQNKLSKGEEVSGFLSTLIASGNMSQDEVYSNISELMAAAVDTTSNTMLWVIYELSRRPDIQSTIRNEVLSIVPRGSTPSAEQIQKMSYLKAFIKEVLRLYPVVSVDTRVTNEDLVLCGYHVPKDIRVVTAVYVLGRNPEYFPDPLNVKPERWLRDTNNKVIHSFAWLPFGYGTRMCIGRRIAELEMHILTSVLLQEFIIKSTDMKPNLPVTRALLVPDTPVMAQFIDRI